MREHSYIGRDSNWRFQCLLGSRPFEASPSRSLRYNINIEKMYTIFNKMGKREKFKHKIPKFTNF